MKQRRRHARKARPILIWTAAAYALLQLAFIVFMDARRPGWIDHQYAWNLADLRQRKAAAGPGASLAVLMGGSRSVNGYIPEWTEPITLPGGGVAITRNFAHTSGGPLMNLMELRRMMRAGETPRWLVFEVMPGMLTHENLTNTHDLMTAADIPAMRSEAGVLAALGRYVRNRYNVFYRYRDQFADEFLPDWVPDSASPARLRYREQKGDRWLGVGPAKRVEIIEATKEDYYADVHTFNLQPRADTALHELLEICAANHIPTALLWAPEGKDFTSWYSEKSKAEFETYLSKVALQFGVPLVDARTWFADRDELFLDSHHLTKAGAEVYTRMVHERVMRPLVLGELQAGTTAASKPSPSK